MLERSLFSFLDWLALEIVIKVIKMSNLKNSAAAMMPVKKEFIVMDLDNEDDADPIDTLTDSGQIVCAADDDDWDTKTDHQYMKLLDSFREYGSSYLRDNPLKSIRYEVDNGGYDMREFKRSGGTGNTIPVIENRGDAHCPVTNNNVESKPHHAEASTNKTTKEADFELRQRESLVTEQSVDGQEMLTTSHVESREKQDSEGEIVFDENYRNYLTWLVENSKNSTRNPTIQVKCEEDTMSFSDSDIIAVEDRPFEDEEDSPFVPSKNDEVVDLEDKSSDHQRSSWFRKEITNLLKQPYNEKEFLELKHEASFRRFSTRCRELRDGREITYDVKDKKIHSYLHNYPDFKRKFRESLSKKDHHRALNLLRGFIFYLQKVSRDDAFKPWLDPLCLKITCY